MLVGYVLASTLLWLAPNPMGGNAVRLGALFGGPVLAAVVLSRRPRVSAWVLALVMAGGLYWQVTASVSQIARSVGDPSTAAAYFQPVARWLREHGGRGVRVEVPPTANHWESAYLAPGFELARGWLRQLDTTRDDIFYDEGELTDRAYSAWLRHNAISYVALPDAPLDYSSAAERRLILSSPPYLAPRWHSAHWRIYAVRNPDPLVRPLGSSRARTRWVGRQGFALDVTRPGDFLVRVNFTPYWSIARGGGCLLRRGDWTVVRADRTPASSESPPTSPSAAPGTPSPARARRYAPSAASEHARETARPSEGQGKRLFEEADYAGEELGALGAVEDAVVAGEGDRHQVGGDDLAVADDRPLLDRADGEDRRLRRVDHRGEAVDPVHPQVGDGEGARRRAPAG